MCTGVPGLSLCAWLFPCGRERTTLPHAQFSDLVMQCPVGCATFLQASLFWQGTQEASGDSPIPRRPHSRVLTVQPPHATQARTLPRRHPVRALGLDLVARVGPLIHASRNLGCSPVSPPSPGECGLTVALTPAPAHRAVPVPHLQTASGRGSCSSPASRLGSLF